MGFLRLIMQHAQAKRRRSQSTRTDSSRRCSSGVTQSSWSSKILSQLPDLRKRRLKMDFCSLQKSSNSHVVSAFCNNIVKGQAVQVILGASFYCVEGNKDVIIDLSHGQVDSTSTDATV